MENSILVTPPQSVGINVQSPQIDWLTPRRLTLVRIPSLKWKWTIIFLYLVKHRIKVADPIQNQPSSVVMQISDSNWFVIRGCAFLSLLSNLGIRVCICYTVIFFWESYTENIKFQSSKILKKIVWQFHNSFSIY